MRSYLTNLTQSVPNFIDWHLTSSRARALSTCGDQPKTTRNPQTLLGFLPGQIYLGPRLLKYVLCYQGKSETENTCWQGHVSAFLHMKWLYRKGKRFRSCAVLFWFLVYVDSVRRAHLEEVWRGVKKLRRNMQGKEKSLKKKKKKGRTGKGIILLPNSHPWCRFPVNADNRRSLPGFVEIQILPFCFWISGKGGRVLQKCF